MCNGKQLQKWWRLVCLNEVFAAAAAFCQREYRTADDMQAKQQCSHTTATRTVQSYRWELRPLMLAFYWDTQAIVIASWSGPAISMFTHTLMNCSLFVTVFLICFMCSMANKQQKYAFAIQLPKGSWQAALNQIAGVCNPVNICWSLCGQCFTQKLIHAFQEAK